MNPDIHPYHHVPPEYMPNTQPPIPPPEHDGWKSVVSAVLLMVGALVIALSIAAFVIQSYQVDGQSMERTLQNNDRLIVDKWPRTWSRISKHPYVPHRGDIIIFNESGIFDSNGSQEKQLIKRVIGLPGDRVVIEDGAITVFNSAHPAGFNPDTDSGYNIGPVETTGPPVKVTLGADEIFVCGDNRPNSEDSRYFGPVKVDQIVGKLVLRLLPAGKTTRF
jgi:signal peptidase I